MASSFALTLDTQAPQISFLSQTPSTVGSTLEVNYSINEPGVLSASLRDSENTLHSMGVHPTKLSLYISEAVAMGPATIELVTRDEVHNQQPWQLPVNIGRLLHLRHSDRARPAAKLSDFSEETATLSDTGELLIVLTDQAGRIIKLTDRKRPSITATDRLS